MKVFHGSNRKLSELDAGSWITNDLDTAWTFAQKKTADLGGEATVMTFEAADHDVTWDIASLVCGIEDERGTLNRDMRAVAVSLRSNDNEPTINILPR
jgi:hypothetical protein